MEQLGSTARVTEALISRQSADIYDTAPRSWDRGIVDLDATKDPYRLRTSLCHCASRKYLMKHAAKGWGLFNKDRKSLV